MSFLGRSSMDMQGTDRITRRQALGSALAGGLVLGAGGVLAGCGGASPSTGGSTAAVTGRRGGSLRVGLQGGGAKDTLDAHLGQTDPDFARIYQLYEPLAARNPQFKIEMVLAESIEASSPTEWTIRLRPDVEFHDGRPLTADDVIYTFRRITDPKNPKFGAAALALVDRNAMKKLDDRTLRIKLTAPNAGFVSDLAQQTALSIVPRGYDPNRPVGTGPFRFGSFTPGNRSVFVRNESYWRPGEPYVDEVAILDFEDGSALVNAMLGGQLDAITNLPAAQIDAMRSNPGFEVLTSETGAWQPFEMRIDVEPFKDVRVRQAMRLLVDRSQMVEQALNGQGKVANDLYAPFDAMYASEFPQREQDIEQARSLLKAAGRSDLRVRLPTAPVAQGVVEAAQVLSQQAKSAGVQIEVTKVETSSYFGDQFLKRPFGQDFWFTRDYLSQVGRSDMPDSTLNATHWNVPAFTKLIKQARGELNESRRRELLVEAQRMQWDQGGNIIAYFTNQVDAHSKKVTGFGPSKTGVPLTNYGFRSVQFVS